MKVIKFGGSSLADAAHIKQVCNIILSDKKRRLVVVSAPGKRHDDDIKVTDMLIALAEKYMEIGNPNFQQESEEKLQLIVERYKSIAVELQMNNDIITVIEADLRSRLALRSNGRRHDDGTVEHISDEQFMDLMKAAGEDNSAKLVASYLINTGVNAQYINPRDAGMILSNEYGNARVLPHSYEMLNKLNENENLMIFPGFFGYSHNGDVVTFSRGGSDVTGAVLAAAVKAEVYENFTDVDSVYAANPRIIEEPKPIPVFTYAEMRELAYAGFTVLHEETLEPVYKMSIPVNIKNTNNPDSPGTFIVPERMDIDETPVVGIAADRGFFTLNVTKYMMNREIGFGRKLLQILEDEGVSYEHTPSGIDSICVVVRNRNCPVEVRDNIVRTIYNELQVDEVTLEDDMAIVMLVGQGMLKRVGLAARATSALSNSKINISMINQGSSEVSIMFGVKGADSDKSVKALYNEFFLNEFKE